MILGVDPGSKRFGIAVADPETRFARPLEVIDASSIDPIDRIAGLVSELGVTTVVVGRPLGLSGRAGPAAATARSFAEDLAARLPIDVEEQDERLTTIEAERGLRAGGGKGRARRALVDAVAAQIMLQAWLDRGRPSG